MTPGWLRPWSCSVSFTVRWYPTAAAGSLCHAGRPRERHLVDGGHADRGPGARGVDHLPVADVQADVADAGVEEHQVARERVRSGRPAARVDLRVRRARQGDAGGAPRGLRQPRAVEGVRAGRAPDIGAAERLVGEGDGLRGACVGRRPSRRRRPARGRAAGAAGRRERGAAGDRTRRAARATAGTAPRGRRPVLRDVVRAAEFGPAGGERRQLDRRPRRAAARSRGAGRRTLPSSAWSGGCRPGRRARRRRGTSGSEESISRRRGRGRRRGTGRRRANRGRRGRR